MSNDTLSTVMKDYEYKSRVYLKEKEPVIIRIDGKAFHTFTRGFVKPFDNIMTNAMYDTMKYLCEHIDGCVLGYTQSDEITLVLCDYKRAETQAWFANNLQKVCSVSASMATAVFNRVFADAVHIESMFRNDLIEKGAYNDKRSIFIASDLKMAMFDSRAYNLPVAKVLDCLVWRQKDAIRNSIEATAHAHFSTKQLHKKNCNAMKEMLLQEKSIDWDKLPIALQRGACCVKQTYTWVADDGNEVIRSKWVIDKDTPLFSENPEYVNSRIMFK